MGVQLRSGKPSTGRDVVWMNSAQTMLPVLRFSSLPPMRTRVFISASISRMVSSTAARKASMMSWSPLMAYSTDTDLGTEKVKS